MSKTDILLALVVLLLLTGCSRDQEEAGDKSGLEPIEYRDDVRREVEDAVWAFHAADTSRNAEAVIDLLWPEFTMTVDGTGMIYDDAVAGARGFMPSLELFHTEWSELRITVLDERHAISAFTFTDSIRTKSGDLIQSRGPNSFVWEKREGIWKLIYTDADHYPITP